MDEITRSQGEETSLQEMVPGVEVVATPKWYELVDLEKSEKFIRANLKNEAMNVIATGYYLKHIKERGFFLEAGYKDFYDYAKAELGFSRSAASRYMSKNSRFSKDGNSPLVAEQYKDYSRSQLQEMLSLDDAELEQVTPEMTVRQIRELRRQKETPVPYIELPGQMSIEDFPGIAEEDAGRAEESQPERIPEKQDFMLDVGDLLPEEDAAKAQQNPEIRCENGSEEEG
ncbi:MAG: hypothetical protein Q4F29_14530, partial [Lachnospiraceae bacterium]|nr:hypothetical protein [Lachnospiraceae bacterium]